MPRSASLVVGVTAEAARAMRKAGTSAPYATLVQILVSFELSPANLHWDATGDEAIHYAYLDLPSGMPVEGLQGALLKLPFVDSAYLKPAGETPLTEGPPG